MQKALLVKALVVAALIVAILVPLALIGGVVGERAARQFETIREISTSYAEAQHVVGPALVLPYSEDYVDRELDEKGAPRRDVARHIQHVLVYFPTEMTVSGTVDTDFKHRGLFKALVYDWRARIAGTFVLPAQPALERDRSDSHIAFGQPFLTLSLQDPRGLSGTPELSFAGRALSFERGSGTERLASGLHAPVPAWNSESAQRFAFTLALGLHGTEELGVAPIGDSNRVAVQSSWPHPSFGGRFLPEPQSQQIGDAGFTARWNITSLASNAQQQMRAILSGRQECKTPGCVEELTIRFVEPVNVYTQSDRALKYGILFVALTFAAFFLFEVMKRLSIHPAQYLLVGLALALFFLLLVSLSEHIAFVLAYAVAALACVALLTFYLAHVLRSAARGFAFGAALSLLYGALYGLLVSEDNALLMGSLLLFALLAAAMVATRRFDWYRLAPAEGDAAR